MQPLAALLRRGEGASAGSIHERGEGATVSSILEKGGCNRCCLLLGNVSCDVMLHFCEYCLPDPDPDSRGQPQIWIRITCRKDEAAGREEDVT